MIAVGGIFCSIRLQEMARIGPRRFGVALRKAQNVDAALLSDYPDTQLGARRESARCAD